LGCLLVDFLAEFVFHETFCGLLPHNVTYADTAAGRCGGSTTTSGGALTATSCRLPVVASSDVAGMGGWWLNIRNVLLAPAGRRQ